MRTRDMGGPHVGEAVVDDRFKARRYGIEGVEQIVQLTTSGLTEI